MVIIMDITENAFKNKKNLIKNELFELDPEFNGIIENFIFDEVDRNNTLDERSAELVRLATLIANQSYDLYRNFLEGSLDILSPEEIKEVLYQSTAYVGLGKSYEFIKITNEVLIDNNIDLPLKSQSTTNLDNRYEKGLELQVKYFGESLKDARDNAKEGQKHFIDFLRDYCFGDYYTRNGLNDQDRELITFAFLTTLGDCGNQLRGHIQGNLNIGNDEKKLINALTVIMPFIGFPRTLNSLAIINEFST